MTYRIAIIANDDTLVAGRASSVQIASIRVPHRDLVESATDRLTDVRSEIG